jgi:hypothetical protein
MASRSLGTLSVDLVAKVGGFVSGMSAAERAAAKSSREIEQRMKRLGKAIDTGLQVAAAAAVAATAAITVGVGNAINRLDEIGKAAQKVGVTTEALSKLAFAAQLADVDLQALQGGLVKLAKSQDMAAQGSAAQLELFQALGVEFKNADGTLRDTGEVLTDLADKFQLLPDGANKTTAALGLLGKSGAQLIPLLNGGSEAIREAGDELDRLGGTVTPEAARQAEQFNDNLTRLRTAADGLFTSLATSVLPSLVEFSENAVDATQNTQRMSEVAEAASSFVRGIGLSAQLAVDGVQQLTSYIEGLYFSLNALSKINVSAIFRGGPGEDIEKARQAFSQDNLAESRANFFGGGGAEAKPFDFAAGEIDAQNLADKAKRELGSEAEVKRLSKALEEQRAAASGAAAAKTASAGASRAQAAADREAADAARAQTEQRAEAYDDIQRVYQAELDAKREQEDADLRAKEIVDQTLADIAFETKLLGLNNLERAKAIELRYANAEAAGDEQDQIIAALENYDQALKEAEGVDFARDATKSVFEDLVDGVGSAQDAVDDFFDNLRNKALQVFSDKLFDGLFDAFKGDATKGGGGIGGFLGSLFGGARAGGGPVYPGKAYLVGEEGPELIRPTGAGIVTPAAETARLRSGGGTSNITFVLPGRNDLRTESQRQADMGRATQRQLARSTA